MQSLHFKLNIKFCRKQLPKEYNIFGSSQCFSPCSHCLCWRWVWIRVCEDLEKSSTILSKFVSRTTIVCRSWRCEARYQSEEEFDFVLRKGKKIVDWNDLAFYLILLKNFYTNLKKNFRSFLWKKKVLFYKTIQILSPFVEKSSIPSSFW
jgi:hypothetical protein